MQNACASGDSTQQQQQQQQQKQLPALLNG
jgi:hypothetical protein